MIVDAHVHIGTTLHHFRPIEVTADDLLREMDANAIDLAVLCPAGAHLAVHNREGNDLVAAAVQAHPDRFIGLATANPWLGLTRYGSWSGPATSWDWLGSSSTR